MPALAHCRQSQIIIAEASSDRAVDGLALKHGATVVRCGVPSRGSQMNAGAAVATGDVLVFQHADTELRCDHLEAIGNAMLDPETVGGAFYRQFDDRHPQLKWLEPVGRLLTRHGGTLFGDQTVFVRRDAFKRLGGYADIPLMEDVEFSKRLRAAGKVAVLDLRCAARRGIIKSAGRGGQPYETPPSFCFIGWEKPRRSFMPVITAASGASTACP